MASRKEALTGDWEELNKELCIFCLAKNSQGKIYIGKFLSNSKIRKTFLVSYNFDCFCYSLYYFSDANRFFDGYVCSLVTCLFKKR